MLNIKYRWQIDEFANEFVRKCAVTQSMYSVLGIDASFLDVEGTVSTATSGPTNTATSVLVILAHVLQFKLQLRVEVIPQWWHRPYSLQALQVLQFKLQLQVEAIP